MTTTPPQRLAVWLHSRHVADLTEDRRGNRQLRYLAEVMDAVGEGYVSLSVSLPVRARPYRGRPVDRWIEGLLPEGETRTLLERQFQVRRGDGFALLAALGRDCAGAVSFLDAGEHPPPPDTTEPLVPANLTDAIADLPSHPLGADEDVRVSLGGLQAKLLLARVGGRWYRPAAWTPSTHIFKPDPVEFPGLVASESFALTAAAMAGADVAASELVNIDGRDVIVVERYDRKLSGGTVTRLHQEDGCQALGLDPTGHGKYQGLGGMPSYRSLAGVLAKHAGDPPREWAKLGRSMTINVALGNTDAHARNHAFLIEGGSVRFAPMYDVAPTAEFTTTRRLALWVDGQAMLTAVTRGHLTREMTSWGLQAWDAHTVVDDTLDRLAAALPAAADHVPTVREDIVKAAQRRTEALRRSDQ